LRKELEDRLARKEWKLEWADVIRDLDNLIEMEVAIGARVTSFAARLPAWRARFFRPAAWPCHPRYAHANLTSVRLRWRESVSLGRFQIATYRE